MKKSIYFILIAFAFIACEKDSTSDVNYSTKNESLSLGASYANDIYYSLSNGVIASTSRTEWDIAFDTYYRSAGIMTNDGNGVKIYVADAAENWDQVDSAGIGQKSFLYNSYTDTAWQDGAFNKNINGTYDYGWGAYNMTTHNVVGDSVHIVVLADGSAKKLLIEKRDATLNAYLIKYANLDGTSEVEDTVYCGDYGDKNFIYYSLVNQTVVDHEPESDTWDIVFTKYYDESIPYIVTGVLTNEGIKVAEITKSDTANNDYDLAIYTKVINTIGSDWKALDYTTYTYQIVDQQYYFIEDANGNYFKLIFTGFEGGSTGNFSFKLTSY